MLLPRLCLIAFIATLTARSPITAAQPPAGRPPVGALERHTPLRHTVELTIGLQNTQYDVIKGIPHEPGMPRPVRLRTEQDFHLDDTLIFLPLIMQSTFSRLDESTLRPHLRDGGVIDHTISERSRLETDGALGAHLGVFPIRAGRRTTLHFGVTFSGQSWSSRIDEAAAAQIAWPQAWPEEVRDALHAPTDFDHSRQLIPQTVERVTQGKLRMVPPYHAAKELVRYAIRNLPTVDDGHVIDRIVPTDETVPVELPDGRIVNLPADLDARLDMPLRGMELSTIDHVAQHGGGSRFDVVRVCVAMLRAAGLPARSVYGIHPTEERDDVFVTWGEVWLPDAGWIPFDPQIMRGHSALERAVTEPWPGFGTIPDLNRRIPLAFSHLSADQSWQPNVCALWSWRGSERLPALYQRVIIDVEISGPGIADPE